MQVTGIIAEFNPFHEGHQYLIKKAKENADYVIIAMSGDYVQRGEPAIIPKHVRAKTALQNGADLVFELPVNIATSSAEGFASGSVSLLSSVGLVDTLLFGAETNKIDLFQSVAHVLEHETSTFSKDLTQQLKKGKKYPEARMIALENEFLRKEHDSNIQLKKFMSSPNNILGIEYCRAIERYHSPIVPSCTKRIGADYHDTIITEQYPSATSIREKIRSNTPLQNYLHSNSIYQELIHSYNQKEYLLPEDFDLLYRTMLLKTNKSSLIQYADLTENLINKIENNKYNYTTFLEYIAKLKTKEITYTRISRALLHILLEIKSEPYEAVYARILGFRKEAVPLLHAIKHSSKIPVLTKISNTQDILNEKAYKQLMQTVNASNLYETVLSNKTKRAFQHEFQKQIVII